MAPIRLPFLRSPLPSISDLWLTLLNHRGWRCVAPRLARWSAAALTCAGLLLLADATLLIVTPSGAVDLGQLLVEQAPWVALALFVATFSRYIQTITSVLMEGLETSDKPLWAKHIPPYNRSGGHLARTFVAGCVHAAFAFTIALELLLELSPPVHEPLFDQLLMGYAVVVAIMTAIEVLRRARVIAGRLWRSVRETATS